ncbi:Uncharacterised protein [Yersinia intermedia]|nr:Uncharacterised protein [Yersinia intermedia]
MLITSSTRAIRPAHNPRTDWCNKNVGNGLADIVSIGNGLPGVAAHAEIFGRGHFPPQNSRQCFNQFPPMGTDSMLGEMRE